MTNELKIKNFSLYGKSCCNPLPWICRTYVKRRNGSFEIASNIFSSEEAAIIHGRDHNVELRYDDLSRWFIVYMADDEDSPVYRERVRSGMGGYYGI